SNAMKENKLDYIPEPMDLSLVDLPESLIQLSERIAENVHEVWAKARIDEGWTYGEKRDDIHKKHPCLVPYDELPEEEKEYDRNTAMNTIKMVKKLGFRIEKED
uniref:Putative ryanodine receptor n=1 Tax=Bacteroides thetaiotaomicron (strain ATCC 29148 / DSM 2079 / JCM 5827 / CCUG 10774 / NCTC 10582 / VPI-5482 / E50) TaxID=226186 RepID=UPI0001E24E5B